MGFNERVSATPVQTDTLGFGRSAEVTRSLLVCGMVVGPFYLAVGLIQAFVRDGFDLSRHALSVLANGPGGWVQTANFVISGLMVLAASSGLARVLGPKSRAASWFLAGFGASMIVAAVFPADPMDGFPVGTPKGYPTSISTSGLVHLIAGTLGFTFLGVSCIIAAWAMRRRKASTLARLSFLSGLAVLLGFFGGAAFSSSAGGILGIWFSVVVGWAWLAILSRHLYRVSRNPNGAPG